MTEVEKPLREASEFAAGLVIFQLTAKQLQKMPASGDGVVNGGDVGLNGGGSCGGGSWEWSAVRRSLETVRCVVPLLIPASCVML